jgi:hypothetical protein
MINKSFQLIRTNPALTANVKLVVATDSKLYLESFDTNNQLSDNKYKHVLISKNSLYEEQISYFFKGLPSQLAFDIKYNSDNTNVFKTYDKQFDDIYWSGAKAIEDNWHAEDYEYFAPLYIKKDSIPDGFVILRVDDATPYEEIDNEFIVTKLTKDNFNTQIVDKWKCVDFYDMRYQSSFGYFLSKNFIENTMFPEHVFELDFRKYEYSRWYGIDYVNGVYVAKSKFLQDILYYEQPHYKLEKELTNFFRDENLIYPNILNIKFLFNDIPSTPNNVKNYSLNRYYGFYIDSLEFVSNLTSYVTPELKPGLTLKNNIFLSGTTEMIESPFIEGFKSKKSYWIHYDEEFYEVVKVYENNKYLYKVLSDVDLSGISFSEINDRSCIINYEEGTNYRCRTIMNPSGYTNYVSGYTGNFKIDPYTDNDIEKSMFGDLYLIQIDGKYHVLKKRGDDYFVQSDYAINSYSTGLEYWKGGKNSDFYVSKPIYQYKVKPTVYPVYRLKFSDIKDFDFDIVNTHFADFDYEKDTYHSTPEHKLYSTDYLDKAVLDKTFMTHSRGEDGQYEIMNVSSEYIADDELYEIVFNDLSDIWRKNRYVIKWGFAGSNSNCDYPYKLNNSIDIGDYFNRTTNTKLLLPLETEKNLDYFYRIGNFYSGNTNNPVYYLNQTTNIEVDFMEYYSKKFNLGIYLKSDVDYFDYFFKNKQYFSVYDILYTGLTLKYALFQGGDSYSPSTTVFKGLNVNILSIDSISRNNAGQITDYIVNSNKNYNDYKFAIILNDVYDYRTGQETQTGGSGGGNIEGDLDSPMLYGSPSVDPSLNNLPEFGLTGNTLIDNTVDAIHVFLNDKFKNVLIVINVKIPILSQYISLNNVSVFGEKQGLYTAKTLKNYLLTGTATGTTFNPSLITASNFMDAFDDLNTLSEFESGITFHYISSTGQLGSTGPINIFNPNCSMSGITNWNKSDPPYMLTFLDPEFIATKKQSYIKEALKGPKTNIYNKYKTYYDSNENKNVNVTEPLARVMKLNVTENNKNTYYGSSKTIYSDNYIYRFNGIYEPIFKDISMFNNTLLYNCSVYAIWSSKNDYYVGDRVTYNTLDYECIKDTDRDENPSNREFWSIDYSNYKYWQSNYKFDTTLENFGLIEELIYSKVNPLISPLKLKNTDQDKSIYPMIDEFGYQFSSRFIFNSSWDKDFYILTNPDQNQNKKNFANLSSVAVVNAIPSVNLD